MKVILARTAGFCWGVRRAMDAVLEASSRSDRNVKTLGPLIHNPQALALLEKRGVGVAATPAEVTGGTLVIRAHGIPIQDLRGLRARASKGDMELVNATCPEVAKVHSRIKRWSPKGYFTVILGLKGHAESTAHQSFAEHGSVIVSSMDEAKALADDQVRKVLVVAQTTFTVQDFREISDYIRSRSEDCIVENTICQDTWTRQAEAAEITDTVDAVVVVGGKNSANTKHLVELAERKGKPVQYVEVAAELDLARFSGSETVGVLAGASTPTWLVEEVVDVLEHHGQRPGWGSRTFLEVLGVPLLLAFGAGATSIGIRHWLGLPKFFPAPIVAACYILAMYLLSPYLDPMGIGSKGPAQARFLERRKGLLVGLGILSLAVALAMGIHLGTMPALVVFGASVLGLLYRRQLVLGPLRLSLQAIPGSKDVLVAMAMAVVLVAMPLYHAQRSWDLSAWAAVAYVASLAFARTIIHNLRDMQNDRIMGRETLPILLGRHVAKHLMLAVLAVGLGLVCWATLQLATSRDLPTILLFFVASAYPAFHLWAYHERFSAGRPHFELPLELPFFLVGLIAFF